MIRGEFCTGAIFTKQVVEIKKENARRTGGYILALYFRFHEIFTTIESKCCSNILHDCKKLRCERERSQKLDLGELFSQETDKIA